MKRDIQAKIYEETKDMTPEQKRERTRQVSERFYEEGKRFQENTKGGDSDWQNEKSKSFCYGYQWMFTKPLWELRKKKG